jgi:ATP-dependent proteinase. Serine peptidase. MEROPS family S16
MPDEKYDELWELLKTPLLSKLSTEATGEREDDESISSVPPDLPILPLRGLVVFPMTAVPIRVGQPRSIRLIDDAVAGKRLIGLVASRNPELEMPGPDDVYRVGTVAAVHRLFKSPDGTITLIMQGLMRIRVEEFVSETPYLTARVTIAPEKSSPYPRGRGPASQYPGKLPAID